MKKYIILSLAALTVLAACNKEGGKDHKTITVKAGIGTMTKVAYTEDKSAFVEGDDLTLFAWTGEKTAIPEKLVVKGVNNTLKSGLWQPDIQMLWADMTTPHYFMAVSPARVVTSFTADPYTLDPAADKFQQSDLLIAINDKGLVATDNPVSLVFDHAMSILNVNLAFHNQWTEGNPPSQTEITEAQIDSVKATAKNHATIDYIHKAVTATGEGAQVAMNKVKNASWTTLMVPQAGFRTLTIKLKGNDEWLGGNGTYVFNASEDITLVSGKVTTVNLIIGRDQITLDKDGITITDWASQGDAIPGEVFKPELN
jgi:hypothetical protein